MNKFPSIRKNVPWDAFICEQTHQVKGTYIFVREESKSEKAKKWKKKRIYVRKSQVGVEKIIIQLQVKSSMSVATFLKTKSWIYFASFT